jgi:uncharacterized protein
MLQLRPNCEHCNIDLPADSTKAMICSYECTFCCDCVTNTLVNVCPNCGGGFMPRPVRPKNTYCQVTGLQHHPATSERTLKPVDVEQHVEFSAGLKNIAANLR